MTGRYICCSKNESQSAVGSKGKKYVSPWEEHGNSGWISK